MHFTAVDHNVVHHEDCILQVPSKHGIYGWYYNFNYLHGFANNPDRIKKMLLDVSEKLKNPEFQAFISAKFGNSFKGELEYNGKFKEKDINERIDELSKQEIEGLLAILQDFTQPLYIGIAQNLKERYATHYKSITENICDADKQAGKCFGHRIQQQKIQIKELVFKYQTLDMERSNIEKIEYIANRFFKPIFGRR